MQSILGTLKAGILKRLALLFVHCSQCTKGALGPMKTGCRFSSLTLFEDGMGGISIVSRDRNGEVGGYDM